MVRFGCPSIIVNMDGIKIVPTIDTPSNVLMITDSKEEIIEKFSAAGYTVISRSENAVKLLKTKEN